MRGQFRKRRWARLLPLLALSASASGCYYLQAAAGQWEVSRKSESISEVIAEDGTPEELAERLSLVQAAREFSIEELGLPDNRSYRRYADIERDFVVWNVFAAPEFSLQARQWCFPVAGCVSYRGYFSKDAALRESKRLGNDGYDVFVGGVSAYSTLGKLNDPVLSTMLRWDDIRLVGVLFHELAHQVIYIKGDTGFNESFATAVEEFGLQRWLNQNGRAEDLDVYWQRREIREVLTRLAADVRADLRALYAAAMDDDEKRRLKADRFEQLTVDARLELERRGHGSSNGFRGEWNNARLVSMTLYEGRVSSFRALLKQCEQDIRCFYSRAEALSQLQKTARDAQLDALSGS